MSRSILKGSLFAVGQARLPVHVFLLAALLIATTAAAQRRVITNDDISSQPSAPQTTAPPSPPASGPAEAASAAAATASSADATSKPQLESEQVAAILKALGDADEYLTSKMPDEASTIVQERWRTMRTQLTLMMGEFNRILDDVRRVEQRQATPSTPGVPEAAPAPR